MFSSPMFWLIILVLAIVAVIAMRVYENRVLYKRWLAGERAAEKRSPIAFYGYYRSPRVASLTYVGAAVLGTVSLMLAVGNAVYNYDHTPHEVSKVSVKAPTTLAEDGTRYVVLNYSNGFTYICGETDQCEGLQKGDWVVYTKYTDDAGDVHRLNLHRT